MALSKRIASRASGALIGLVLATLPVSQASAAPACGTYYCTDVLITMFTTMSDGTVYVATDGPVSSLQCTLGGGTQMTLLATSSDRLYSFLMTAYFQKARVQLRILENSSGCTILYAY